MSQGNPLDLDLYLFRMNKVYGDDFRTYHAYIYPTITVPAALAGALAFVTLHCQKDRREQIGFRRLMAAIVFVQVVTCVCGMPLPAMMSNSVRDYTDYMEYKWCEMFYILTSDIPLVLHNIITFYKIGLAVHGIILVFRPNKEEIWLTSKKTVLFCIVAFVAGVLMYIPNTYLTDFIKVEWSSRIDVNEPRTCCVVIPKQSIFSIDFYQRDVFLSALTVTGGFPILVYTVFGTVIAVKLMKTKKGVTRANNTALETFQQRQVCKTIAISLFAFAILNIPVATNFTLVTLVYGQIKLPYTMDEIRHIVSISNIFIGIARVVECFTILPILIIFEKKFQKTFLRVIRCKCKTEKTDKNTEEQTEEETDGEKGEKYIEANEKQEIPNGEKQENNQNVQEEKQNGCYANGGGEAGHPPMED